MFNNVKLNIENKFDDVAGNMLLIGKKQSNGFSNLVALF